MFLVDFIDWWGGIEGWSIFVFPILFDAIRRHVYFGAPPFSALILFTFAYQREKKKKKLSNKFKFQILTS